MKLLRYQSNPILVPIPESDWESKNVFNPSVIYHNGLFHMHYRAEGKDLVSRIGYAISSDGLNWNRLRNPVLEPSGELEVKGVEDPRVTILDDVFYMAYTAFGKTTPDSFCVTPMFAKSNNLIEWERIGPLVKGEDNKDHVLFPRRINDRFVSLHRRPPQVWLAESEDLKTWPETLMRPIFSPREDNWWDNKRVGGNGVPIETEHGWLMLYHAYDHDHVYRLGVCILDLEKPWQVVHRPKEPIFEPQEEWELQGTVPNVVFSCANPVVDGIVYVYYGGADHVIGLATCEFKDLLEYARFG